MSASIHVPKAWEKLITGSPKMSGHNQFQRNIAGVAAIDEAIVIDINNTTVSLITSMILSILFSL